MTGFQPDEVLSVKESIAVYDRDYTQTSNTFRFVMPDNRQFLLQVDDEYEMNEWLTLINYASTFKTAAIRMRATGLNSGDAVKAGSVAAEEHRRDVASGTGYQAPETSQVRSVLFEDAPAPDEPVVSPRPMLRRVGSLRSSPAPVVDISGANDVVVNGGEQMDAVIGSVKAELAAGRAGATRTFSFPPSEPTADTISSKTLRSDAIQRRVQQLKSEAALIEQRLTSNLRIARNLAILTPFQKSTRDRIEAALPSLANQIRSDRIELSKLHLWITMLLKDQDRDQRDWARVRHVALQAAARSLCAPGADRADRRATIAAPIAIPKLALPDDQRHNWDEPSGGFASGTQSPGELAVTNPLSDDEPSPRPSSPSDPTSDSEDYELAPEYLGSSESLRGEMERQLAFTSSPPLSPTSKPQSLAETLTPVPPERKESEDGQVGRDLPEHWRNTRAATKVSLAHLPRSSLGELSRKFIKIEGGDVVVNGDQKE